MKNIVSPGSESFLWPISYSYDYMSGCPEPSSLSAINEILPPDNDKSSDAQSATEFPSLQVDTDPKVDNNSIPLHPIAAGLPWHTTINVIRQNKHWKRAILMTNRLLELFATDQTASVALRQRSKMYADVAKAEMGHAFDSWCRFTVYLWPAADERRMELMAATIVIAYIFDDIWEMNDDETIRKIQTEYISRLKVPDARTNSYSVADNTTTTPLQALITETMRGFYEEDLNGGNGGKDVVDHLIDFINHPPPPAKGFTTLREFLDYRIQDAAAWYIFACVKFSLRSNVDIHSPRIALFMRLALDHVCYANDLGSFDKEKEAYVRGKAFYLINVVDMVQKVFALPDENAAKSATLALQLRNERQLGQELERLRSGGGSSDASVTAEELEYVEAVVYCLVGSVFSSVVMSSYGREAARLYK